MCRLLESWYDLGAGRTAGLQESSCPENKESFPCAWTDASVRPALAAGTYTTLAYPIVTFVACLVFAIVKIGNGVFLLYQRSYARKNRPVNQ